MRNVTSAGLTAIILPLAASSLAAATHYVSVGSTNPTPPYTDWVTAAKNIQDAVNVAKTNDVVVVSNGVYAGGVVVSSPLTLRSINGPLFTLINGGGANRCVSLADGASLTGFTLTNGMASQGGAVWCPSTNAFLTNCTLTGNSAGLHTTGFGGGAYGGTLYNCTLTANSASGSSNPNGEPGFGGGACLSILYNCTLTANAALFTPGGRVPSSRGGGASGCTLYDCTLSGNSAGGGGGAYSSVLYNCTLSRNSADGALSSTLYNCVLANNNSLGAIGSTCYNCTLTGNTGQAASATRLYNCIVYFNAVMSGGANYDSYSTLNYCCTTPLPLNGVGNITNDPAFVAYSSGNLRLQSNSPCINAGNNAYVTNSTDLDGRPRIVGGTVDMGAYEFQPGVSGAFIGWLQQYSLPTDGSADYADPDHDGMDNWQDWICGTCPTNPASALCLLSATPQGTNVTVTWQSVAGVNYLLGRSTKLGSPFTLVATNIVGQAGITSYADPNATGAGPLFYRVGVKLP
jgi:hypothetical protein